MNQLPLISVIIPAYNAEQWIEQCCYSVIEQTYKNLELIVVDDGSKDSTFSILKTISNANPSVKVIHTENGGVCRARNIGINAVKGEFFVFLDADDLLVPDALYNLYNAVETHHADIVIGSRADITSDGEYIGCPYPSHEAILTDTQALEYALKDHPSSYTVWGKLYKKSFVEDILFVEGKRVHEDSFFVFQCFLKKPKVVLIDDIIVHYRRTPNSASRAVFSEKYFDIIFFAERKKDYIDKLFPQYMELADNIVIKANMALLRNLCRTRDKKYRVYEKQYIREIKKRKDKFIPALSADKRFFWIVTHNLYSVYKNVYINFFVFSNKTSKTVKKN